MSAIVLGIISFVCVVGGLLVGLMLCKTLPDHHLSDDSRDSVKTGAGLIATLSALVLGLLVSSAKDTFDDMSNAVTESSAKLIVLDRAMEYYGPETQPIRKMLRQLVARQIAVIWSQQMKSGTKAFEKEPVTMEIIAEKMRAMTPQSDAQREFRSEALQLCKEILMSRWLVIEQSQLSLPPVFIVVLLFWLTILFASIGLLSPTNRTVIAFMLVCAISVSGAIFLIEEMNKPLDGMVKISSAPIRKAIEIWEKDLAAVNK